jgi:hypothetical protein
VIGWARQQAVEQFGPTGWELHYTSMAAAASLVP